MARKPKGCWTEVLGMAPKDDPLEYQRRWREANPGDFKEWKYGVTQEQYESMLQEQENSCAICKTKEPKGRHNKFQIDHCHETGKVRGLLCWPCNTALGKFQDDPTRLYEAIQYLYKHKE